jgi:hypothetical protein
MSVDQRRYSAEQNFVFVHAGNLLAPVAKAESNRLAKRIANALNIYRPRVRRRKPSEKQMS